MAPAAVLAQQPVEPRWTDKHSVICPEGYEYWTTERLCWESNQLKQRRSNQEAAAKVFFIVAALGTIAGVYLGLRQINREEDR